MSDSTWRRGKPSDAVVCDEPGHHAVNATHVDYYGGHLVAKSIGPQHMSLILVAPALLDLFEAIVRAADGRQLCGHLILDENNPLIVAARDLSAQARKEPQ